MWGVCLRVIRATAWKYHPLPELTDYGNHICVLATTSVCRLYVTEHAALEFRNMLQPGGNALPLVKGRITCKLVSVYQSVHLHALQLFYLCFLSSYFSTSHRQLDVIRRPGGHYVVSETTCFIWALCPTHSTSASELSDTLVSGTTKALQSC